MTVVDLWVNAISGPAAARDLLVAFAAAGAFLGGTAARLLRMS